MSLKERIVDFDCGHRYAVRVAKNGRSLLGELIHCHHCGREKNVTAESPPWPFGTNPR